MKKVFLLITIFFLLAISYHTKAQNWDEITKSLPVTQEQHIIDEYFGKCIDIDGNYAVVGTDTKYAYVLFFDGEEWITQAELTTTDQVDHLGSSVSISGDNIVIGALHREGCDLYRMVYVFSKNGSVWSDMTETAELTRFGENSYNAFGTSVCISGDHIVVGDYYDDANGIHNSGSAYVYSKPGLDWVDMTETVKLTVPDGNENDYFGSSVAILDDHIVVGAEGDIVGSAYVFNKINSSWTEAVNIAKLTPSDDDYDKHFGCSVSMSGDDIVIGAKYDIDNDGENPHSGSAYVFSKTGSSWTNMTQTAKLTTSENISTYIFGVSVDISGNQIVVGSDNFFEEAVFIFAKTGSSWTNMTESANLSILNENFSLKFGESVCISGDHILSGAKISDKTGAVFCFKKIYSTWTNMTETDKILPYLHTDNISNFYGESVAIDGNYAVVGASGYDQSKGMAYVLFYNDSNWTIQAELRASDVETDFEFGHSVSISGDHIVVGAPRSSLNYGDYPGVAYVFSKTGDTWSDMTETAKLTVADIESRIRFGYSVSISGDNIVVGAPEYRTEDLYNFGRAYVFSKTGDTWSDMTETAKLTASNATSSDQLGISVSISGDNIVAGAPKATPVNETGSPGVIYLYSKPGEVWEDMTETAQLYSSGPSNNYETLGISVSISGDFVAAGKCGENNGTAYVFKKTGEAWTNMTEINSLTASDADLHLFSHSRVSINDNYIVVGIPENDNQLVPAGSVYFFKKPGSNWVDMEETRKFLASDGMGCDNYGASIAVASDHIVIGSNFNDALGNKSGAAYFYKNSNIRTTFYHDICFNSSFTFANLSTTHNITENLTHNSYFTAVNGNDSIVTENLLVYSLLESVVEIDLCMNSSHTFADGTVHTNIIENEIYTSTLLAQSFNGCDSTVVENITVISIPSSAVELDLCSGNTFTFSDGTIHEDIMVDESYTSVLVGAAYSSCDSIVVENITVLPVPTTNIEVNLCSGVSFTFADGSTHENIIIEESYTSILDGQAFTGCDSIVTENISIETIDVSVTDEGLTLIANLNDAAYQWLDCNNNFAFIDGESFQTYTAEENGAYAVLIDDGNCVNRSDCYTITSVELSELISDLGINIYPNPTQDYLNIEIDNKETTQIKLLTITGQLLIEKSFISQVKLDLKTLAKASYILVLENAGRTVSHKIVVE